MSALFPGLAPLFELIDNLSRPEVIKAIRASFEDFERRVRAGEKACIDFTVHNGWVGLDRHFTDEQLHLLLRISAEWGLDAANARVPDFFPIKRLEEIVEEWRAIPYFQSRGQLCSDAIQAYRLGFHSLLVPALIPLAEGLSAEIVGGNANDTQKVIKVARAQRHHGDDSEFSEATLAILESWYGRTDFGQPAPTAHFNRHWILHGRSSDYATRCNSLRAFLLVDTVADIWWRLKKA